MSPSDRDAAAFERRSRLVLQEGIARVDARVRSRLNQARHAVLAGLDSPQRTLGWWKRALVPAGVAAAALVAVILVSWQQHPRSQLPLNPANPAAAEDLELLADEEGIDLVQDESTFYEWANAQDG